MKLTLLYDPVSGNLTDRYGTIIITYTGLENNGVITDPEGMDAKTLCQLKDAGFTADEIVMMKRKEVI